ncbi:hypothetical protein N431DRAFT_475038 [Stipitochalara longipes BDJ]|nr:hypothetical protein N431DRAFT_475038 [Stipitochalara longipes BDJ]
MSNSSNITLSGSGPLNDTECRINGNADMYGLGIRTGFYLQWISSIVACIPVSPGKSDPPIALAPGESENTIFGLIVFIIATFLGLLRQTQELAPVEIYIILLLIFGFHYYWFPDSIMRVILYFTSRQMLKREKPNGIIQNIVVFLFVLSISAYQLWFWFAHFKPSSTGIRQCQRFGFSFIKINLDNRIFCHFNVAYSFVLFFWSLLSLGRGVEEFNQPIQKKFAKKAS